MESRFGRLGEPFEVITADMIRGRLLQIAALAQPGEYISTVLNEIEYVVDTLKNHVMPPPA